MMYITCIFTNLLALNKIFLSNMVLTTFQVKAHKDMAHFETAYVVKLHNVARLAPTQPVSGSSCSLFFNTFVQFIQKSDPYIV